MAILPINSISVMKNQSRSVNFQGHNRSEHERNQEDFSPKVRMSAVTVPVAVLMAMSPSLLNAKEPMRTLPMDNGINSELFEKAVEAEEPATYYSVPADYNQDIPNIGNWRRLKNKNILLHKEILGNGAKYHMLFAADKGANPNSVEYIYVIRDGAKGSDDFNVRPPEVTKFTYHNIGKDKEFCSVRVHESIIGPDGKENGTMIREIKIDDDAANQIIYLIAGETKWKDSTMLHIDQTTSPRIMEPKIVDD